jgi:acyl-CoA thioesterase-1
VSSASDPLILAFGDSLVAGYGLPLGDAFPAQLQRRLRATLPGAEVLNAGVSGDTTAGGLRRLPGVLSRLSRRPDLAIVELGANDVLQRVAPARTRANLDAILSEIGRCGIPVLLAAVEPPAFLHAHASAYLPIYGELAAKHGVRTCSFFPDGVLGHPTMVLFDRVHPNARAITRVVDAMLPVILELLPRSRSAAA